jgi:hypothetical protein
MFDGMCGGGRGGGGVKLWADTNETNREKEMQIHQSSEFDTKVK